MKSHLQIDLNQDLAIYQHNVPKDVLRQILFQKLSRENIRVHQNANGLIFFAGLDAFYNETEYCTPFELSLIGGENTLTFDDLYKAS